MPMLRMVDIRKRFGMTRALAGVSFEVQAGEVMGLVGENGAGKSTLMRILSGALAADSGTMELEGRPYVPRSPLAARLSGVAMIYQELNLAPDLTVEDNIMLGQERTRWGILRRPAQRQLVRQALDLLGHPELEPQAPVASLSLGARQLVEIARALVLDARLLVFDEPTSALTLHDVEHLFRVIRRLQQQRRSVIYISHFLEEIRAVCDRLTILRDGQTQCAARVDEITSAAIVAHMAGRTVDELYPTVPHSPGDVLLSIRDVSGRATPKGVTLDVRRGEILGIAGLVGAGRTELLRAIYALDPVVSGQVRVAGRLPGASPRARIRAGMGMVSEDRKGEGLALGLSVADNVTLSRLRPYAPWGWIHALRRRASVDHWRRQLAIKTANADQPVGDLSGGNQQKVALARVLHQRADVLLMDEPTRGIDVGTKAEIYRLVGELAAQGQAIILVSSYLPELLAVCDRIAVMRRGSVCDVRPADQWTQESILTSAIGGNHA